MVHLDFLKNVNVFNGLNDDQLAAIIEICHEKEHRGGDRLFEEGEKANRVWIVSEGQVDIRFNLPGRIAPEESTIYSETFAKTFGWSCFVPPYEYILSAYCSGKSCKVVQIHKEALLKLFEKDSLMGYIFMSNLAGIISMRFHNMQRSSIGLPYSKIKVLVHMATCGIAAGAREVMGALTDEISASERQDIEIESAGCLGKCSEEPNVTIEISGEEPVVYGKMSPEKMRQVFKGHILDGKTQKDFLLSR